MKIANNASLISLYVLSLFSAFNIVSEENSQSQVKKTVSELQVTVEKDKNEAVAAVPFLPVSASTKIEIVPEIEPQNQSFSDVQTEVVNMYDAESASYLKSVLSSLTAKLNVLKSRAKATTFKTYLTVGVGLLAVGYGLSFVIDYVADYLNERSTFEERAKARAKKATKKSQ